MSACVLHVRMSGGVVRTENCQDDSCQNICVPTIDIDMPASPTDAIFLDLTRTPPLKYLMLNRDFPLMSNPLNLHSSKYTKTTTMNKLLVFRESHTTIYNLCPPPSETTKKTTTQNQFQYTHTAGVCVCNNSDKKNRNS